MSREWLLRKKSMAPQPPDKTNGQITEGPPLTRTFTLKCSEYIGQPEKKKYYNEQLFSVVAPKYDFITRALSLGRDGAWKRQLVNALPTDMPAPRCVDLACGTGDVCQLLADRYPHGTVIGIDLTEAMLQLAKQRKQPANLSFVQRDMCATGLESGSVDVVTGSYALRNSPDLEQALVEVRRILKPGGVAAFLDFSKPVTPSLQTAEYLLLKSWGSFWGVMLHGNHEVYAYIAESLAAFPDRAALRVCASRCGFTVTASRRFFLGVLEMLVFTT